MFARMRLCLLLAVAFVNAGFAESSETNPEGKARLTRLSLEQLGNTEVTTVSKEPVKINRTPAAIYVITQADIRHSGATSIPEVLRLAPGVEVSRIDSHRWSLGVRGFESNLSRSVLVLIDGRSVYTPLFAGVYWEVQDALLEDVERIEIIRGPGGTIWGANAVNAVISIGLTNSKAPAWDLPPSSASFTSMAGGFGPRAKSARARLFLFLWQQTANILQTKLNPRPREDEPCSKMKLRFSMLKIIPPTSPPLGWFCLI